MLANAVAVLLVLLAIPAPSSAGWVPNGNRISSDIYDTPHPIRIASDAHGGVFAGWAREWSGMVRLASDGELAPGWSPSGNAFTIYPRWVYGTILLPDGSGGVFTISNAQNCAASCGGEETELRIQHLTRDGSPLEGWPAEGKRVGSAFSRHPFTPTHEGRQTVVVADGEGGVLIAWVEARDHRFARGPRALRAQRISGGGELLWGEQGIEIRSLSLSSLMAAVAGDGSGGAFLFWIDERDGGLYEQHVSASGDLSEPANGRALVRTGVDATSRIRAVPDRAHGAIVLWKGVAGARRGIFTARITRGGGGPWGRGNNFVQLLDTDPAEVDSLLMVATPDGGAIVAWRAKRAADRDEIRAQRLSHRGRALWLGDGIAVCSATGPREHLALCPDDGDGAFLAWADSRPSGAVFASRILGSGERAPGWTLDGDAVCSQIRNPQRGDPALQVTVVELAEGGADGAILTWTDDREYTGGGNFHVRTDFATRLALDGPVAPPTASLAALKSVGLRPTVRPPAARIEETLGIRVPSNGTFNGQVELALPNDAPTTIELFDVAGRRLWSRTLEGLGIGAHSVSLARATELSPGVYVLRIHQSDRIATRAIVFTR